VAKLAKEFVCVRVQSMNGINLELFPFEYDLTWMSFFMDANDGVYARYGGRDDTNAESHLSKSSLLWIMQTVQALHQSSEAAVDRVLPPKVAARTPEDIPTMPAMMLKRKEKCIHCHDVKVAELRHQQSLGRFRRENVFTYPTPVNVGIHVDATEQNRIRSVADGSPAAQAGVRAGDVVLRANRQRVLTLGDFSRVLELTPKVADLPLELRRDGDNLWVTLNLSGDWRKTSDPSWRESLHVAGPNNGFWGRKLNADERQAQSIPADAMAVKVTHIWGDYTRQAGLRVNDVVLSLDGIQRDLGIQQLHAHAMLKKEYGDSVPVLVRRGDSEVKLTLTYPKTPPTLE
jgi:hypothetical protein